MIDLLQDYDQFCKEEGQINDMEKNFRKKIEEDYKTLVDTSERFKDEII